MTADASQARDALVALRAEVGKAVVGHDAAVTGLIIALLCRGHVLIEGVPGVAKTLLVRALAAARDLECTRVQFPPGRVPGDANAAAGCVSHNAGLPVREGPVITDFRIADRLRR